MRRLLLLVPLILLVAAPPALGGGFATVGLSSTPTGVEPGQPWKVDITVLAHGRTPVDGLPPIVRIRSGDAVREFTAEATDKTGVYHASVVFPTAGRWDYEVVDGYVQQLHTFPSVEIGDQPGAPAAAPSPEASTAPVANTGGGIATGWLWAAGAALVLALAVLGFDRRRRHGGAVPGAAEPA